MLKTLLVAVNSKFTHTSLSVRTLSANAGGVEFAEFTINEDVNFVASEIYEKLPDVICFSCYIWNVEYVLKLASVMKKMLPDAVMVLGGPEVSFSAAELLKEYSFIDCIIRGEGEETFRVLTENGFSFDGVEGITYRNGEIIENPDRPLIKDIDTLIFPYDDDDLEKNCGKLIYYESSRGCPYNCSYCLSSTFHGLRFKSIEKVESELLKIIKFRPKTVKFVDRTFNADNKRTIELIKFMKENGRDVTFHFEIEAHTLSDEFFDVIADAPDGMFRFEAGLQSTNPETLKAICRNDKADVLCRNIKRITEQKNICVHLDLIAGLPMETADTFKQSFNDALNLKPAELQLGFLKLLKGTKIRNEAEKYSYVYREFPPYEVISNSFMTCGELLELKKIEELVDKFYNSGAFKGSLEYMKSYFGDYMTFFKKLESFYDYSVKHSRESLYKMMADFGTACGVEKVFFDILKFDWLSSNVNAVTPSWSLVPYDTEIHKKRIEIIEMYRDSIFAVFGDMHVREILKNVHFERFLYRIDGDGTESPWVGVFEKHGRYLGETEF